MHKTKVIVVFFSFILIVGFSLSLIQAFIIYHYYSIGKTYYGKLTLFSQVVSTPDKKVLFLGDSTARGTGAETNLQSLPGHIAKMNPRWEVEVRAKDGRNLSELYAVAKKIDFDLYDLIVIQSGGIDLLFWSSLEKVEDYLKRIMGLFQERKQKVIFLHSGNVGLAPIFIWPFSKIMTWRSQKFVSLYQRLTLVSGHFFYLNLYEDKPDENDYLTYSEDLLHPNGKGYKAWAQKLKLLLESEVFKD